MFDLNFENQSSLDNRFECSASSRAQNGEQISEKASLGAEKLCTVRF